MASDSPFVKGNSVPLEAAAPRPVFSLREKWSWRRRQRQMRLGGQSWPLPRANPCL